MSGYEVKFNIFAESQEEADAVARIFKDFVNENAARGVAVSASRILQAFQRWGGNAFIRQRINNYFA